MAKVKTTGLNETIKMLESITKESDEILEASLVEGGGIVTDVMRAEVSSLKTGDNYAAGKEKKRYARLKEIQGLLDSLGYTPVHNNNDVFDIKTGFDGYNGIVTKKYPRGHANQMVANAINKGTSFMQAQPFINRTTRKAKSEAIDAIEKKLDSEIKKLTF